MGGATQGQSSLCGNHQPHPEEILMERLHVRRSPAKKTVDQQRGDGAVISQERRPSRMSEDFTVDDIDRSIVAQLRINGRATNLQIAEKLDLTAATVSTRIRRMEDADKLRVVAVSDFSAHGYNVLLELAIEVDGRPASEVAAELAEFDEVFAAHLVTGRYDIDMLVVLRGFDELPELLFEKFSKVRGVRSMMPAIAVDVIKYEFDVAPIESRAAT
jgi:Lrp/AsnC family leucine-responsive transcriptional regulator